MTQKVRPSTLADTAVTANTYGGSTQHAVVTVDAQGRLTFAANATPSIATSQLTGSISPSQLANTQYYGINITGNAATSNLSVNSTTASNANNSANLVSGLWTISVSGTKLMFNYNGTNVVSINSNGTIVSANDVTGFGTP